MMRWHKHFLELSFDVSKMSKDPSTKVGCVLVDSERIVRATGFNGLPRGIADTDNRLGDRATKLSIIVHAEMNAILQCARIGTPVLGLTAYTTAHDSTGIWGGAPCVRCAVEMIQAGIKHVVTRPFKPDTASRWAAEIIAAQQLLAEAGVTYVEIV